MRTTPSKSRELRLRPAASPPGERAPARRRWHRAVAHDSKLHATDGIRFVRTSLLFALIGVTGGWNAAAARPGSWPASAASGCWSSETVATELGFEDPSMVLDGSGITHISYVENGRLVYTTNGEGEWVSATLYADEEVRVSWMSVDREGYLHIIFSTPRSSFSKLWYAANTSGDWLIEPFEVVGAVRIADFVIDEEGVMHLIHVFCADDDDGPCWLYYTTNATDEWVTETVDISMSLTAGAHSLAVDRNGKAHISYHQYRPGGLQKYATNPAGKWNIETLEAGGHDGSALALDDAGNAYIAYTMNYSIRYASNASGKWTAETVDTGGRDLRLLSPSLGLDGKGRAHIAYHRWSLSRGDLKYATNLSGDWLMETVDAGGYTGSRPSLALDHDGRVHIAYIDYANRARTLRYAQAISCGPPWSN